MPSITKTANPHPSTPHPISESYQRFNQKHNNYYRPFWDPSQGHIRPLSKRSQLRQIEQGIAGYGLKEYALAASASVAATCLGTDINQPDSGLTSWESLPLFSFINIPEPSSPVVDAAAMTGEVKRVARYLGADLVGIAQLDMRWVYSHHYLLKEDETKAVEIDDGYKYVIAMALGMDYRMIATAPGVVHMTETLLAYSRMAFLVAALAQFIRYLGYRAIPSLNDTALNVPIAIDAGLGQQGRHSMLISPQFGPRNRICKIITDLPLRPDRPIDFGVTHFCTTCQKCIKACPARAIPGDGLTAEALGISNNPGVMKWPLDAERCREFMSRVGTNCGICMRVCPFNKDRGRIHHVSRWFIKHIPYFDPWLVRLDNLLGYGKRLDSQLFWKDKI